MAGRVVHRWDHAVNIEPDVVLEPLERIMDDAGLGRGPVRVAPLGDGLSNLTYEVIRDDFHAVLRRAPSQDAVKSHDVVREARFVRPLSQFGVPAPEVLLVVEDASTIGVPFVLFEYIDGLVVTEQLPSGWDAREVGPPLMDSLVAALAQLHDVPWDQLGLGRPERARTFIDRQIELFERIRTQPDNRQITELEHVGEWLRAHRPQPTRLSIVHGDFRLGNVMFDHSSRPSVRAILDWEVAAVGDPLADLGYLLAMYPTAGDDSGLLLRMAAAGGLAGFPSRAELMSRYCERAGVVVGDEIRWYMAMALWRTAIGLDSLYGRARRRGAHHPWVHEFETEVPLLAERALRAIHRDPAFVLT